MGRSKTRRKSRVKRTVRETRRKGLGDSDPLHGEGVRNVTERQDVVSQVVGFSMTEWEEGVSPFEVVLRHT